MMPLYLPVEYSAFIWILLLRALGRSDVTVISGAVIKTYFLKQGRLTLEIR